jgi:hypothetical protein
MNIDDNSFERVEEFKYLGTILTNQNSIQEEIMSRLKSRNGCYHSVQNLLSSGLISQNLKIKVVVIRVAVASHLCVYDKAAMLRDMCIVVTQLGSPTNFTHISQPKCTK